MTVTCIIPVERRSAWLKWRTSPDATGYVLYAATAPDKLYTSVMVYGANEYYFRERLWESRDAQPLIADR